MQTIAIDKVPVVIKEKTIVEIQVSKIGMLAFHKLSNEASSLVGGGGKKWSLAMRRLRIKHQARAIADDGTKLTFDDMDITQLPIPYVSKLEKAVNGSDDEKAGEIIGNGDGVSSPILFKLGTPIPVQSNSDKAHISELEFHASTYGDIEEVLAEVDQLGQTVALLRQTAKPLGVNDTLQRLPDWALDKITLADAFYITENVLPRFLE
jgi:hypothetical protein